MTDIDPDDARDAADDILSRSEFRERPQTLVSRALEWLTDRIGDLLGDVLGGQRGAFVGYLLVALAIVVALYFLWRVMPRRRLAAPGASASFDVVSEEDPSRGDWLARAEEAEREGRWEDAVHARYHALTTGLVDVAELSPERSATSGRHRREFAVRNRDRPARIGRFDRTTYRYEQVWFGADPADGGDSAAVADDDAALLGPSS